MIPKILAILPILATSGCCFSCYQQTQVSDRESAPPKNEPAAKVFKTTTGVPDGSEIRALDSEMLPKLLEERGYVPPSTFKALVIEIVKQDSDGFVYQPYDYRGTSIHRGNWWPASTVKLFAAIAALEQSRAMGFTPDAELTFKHREKPVTRRLEYLVRRAITDSRNPEFDRLVEFVGSDRLNDHFLDEKNGLQNTVMLRAYTLLYDGDRSFKGPNRYSPKIVVEEKDRRQVLPERNGSGEFDCPDEGNCTTLADLAEAIRRVMMHETLPPGERYALGDAELQLLRTALEGKHARGGVADGIRAAFRGRKIRIFHKGGYAYGWFSDNVFLHVLDTDERWIISMTNRPGRGSLDKASLHIAESIASEKMKSSRSDWQ